MRDCDPVYDRCGVKMRKPRNEHMSAGLPPIANIARRSQHGRKVPRSAMCSAAILLDRLVGAGVDGHWDVEAERFGGLEVYDQLEARWLLDRQIRRFRALQNPVHV